MRRRRRTLAEHVIRSLAASAVVYAAVAAYALPAALLAERGPDATPGAGVMPGPGPRDQPTWRPAYGDRYPGCENLADWAERSSPRTVVVVTRDGGLARLPFEDAFARATAGGVDGVWAVGACR